MPNIVRRAEERDIPAIMELLKQVNRVHYDGSLVSLLAMR